MIGLNYGILRKINDLAPHALLEISDLRIDNFAGVKDGADRGNFLLTIPGRATTAYIAKQATSTKFAESVTIETVVPCLDMVQAGLPGQTSAPALNLLHATDKAQLLANQQLARHVKS